MSPVRVVPIGAVDAILLESIAAAVALEVGEPCRPAETVVDPAPRFHPERGQYHSTELLEDLAALGVPERVLGVTSVDLYIPILTFVFGEAHVDGDCAVVSYHRMRQEYYGLPNDHAVTKARLIKEAIHEIGHTYGLLHCDDYECVMAASHAVEWLDLKGQSFCTSCREQVRRAAASYVRRGDSHQQ